MLEEHKNPAFTPRVQFWVPEKAVPWPRGLEWLIAFRDIARATDERTAIAAIIARSGVGNTLPLILPKLPSEPGEDASPEEVAVWEHENADSIQGYKRWAPLLLANLNALCLDYVARQKVQSTHLNWYIAEQLPVIPASAYETKLGTQTVQEIVRKEVLRLTYVSHDMTPFARDMGYSGAPSPWDEELRRHSRARLDALYFRLYGLDRDDASYILGTFPIVREADENAFGRFRTKDLILGYMAAFAAGDTDSIIAA